MLLVFIMRELYLESCLLPCNNSRLYKVTKMRNMHMRIGRATRTQAQPFKHSRAGKRGAQLYHTSRAPEIPPRPPSGTRERKTRRNGAPETERFYSKCISGSTARRGSRQKCTRLGAPKGLRAGTWLAGFFFLSLFFRLRFSEFFCGRAFFMIHFPEMS